jgi:hypothetical protein
VSGRAVRRDLNHAPRLGDDIRVESRVQDPSFTPRSSGVALVDLATHFFVGATDPDADPMLVEWDLDGDGAFDQSRVHRNRDPAPTIVEFYRAPARLRVRVRVSDFPERRGIPGEASLDRMLAVVDPDTNREPTAAFAIRPTPARAGDPVTFDGSASSDPDFSTTCPSTHSASPGFSVTGATSAPAGGSAPPPTSSKLPGRT